MDNIFTTPKGTLGYSSFFVAKPSPLKPDKPQFFGQLLLSATALQQPSWKDLLAAIEAEGRKKWPGGEYEAMVKRGAVHLPIRTDMRKGWPEDTAA